MELIRRMWLILVGKGLSWGWPVLYWWRTPYRAESRMLAPTEDRGRGWLCAHAHFLLPDSLPSLPLGREEAFFSLLSDKKTTPGKVMYLLKVTQVIGNSFFSWTLEVIGTYRKDMVWELARICVHMLPLWPLPGFMYLYSGVKLSVSGLLRVTWALTHV